MLLGFALRGAGVYWGQAYSYFQQGDGIAAYSVAVDFGMGEPRSQYIGQPAYNDRSKLPGPLWAVFCFMGLRYGGSVYGIVWATVLLNTVLIYLAYLLAQRTVGATAGVWAALLTATLPWPVYYSVGVYNPDIMGFLGALLCLALWETATVDRSKVVAWVPFLLLAMLQVHMSGLMLIPAFLVVLLLCPGRLNVPWLLGGLFAGLLLYLPYVRGELANGFQNTHGMFWGKGGYSWDSLKVFSIPEGLLLNWVPQWVSHMKDYREMGKACCGSWTLFLTLNLVSVVFAILLLVSAFRRIRSLPAGTLKSPRQAFRQNPGVLFLLVMIVVPLAFSLGSGKPFHTRYFLVLLAPFLAFMGAAASNWRDAVWAGRRAVWRRLFAGSAAITICANLVLIPAMYRWQGNRIENTEVLIPSWRKLEQIYQALRSRAGQEHSVQVDDAAYLEGLAREKTDGQDARLIRQYVIVREKEAAVVVGRQRSPCTFVLRKSEGLASPRAAYAGQGIELVETSR